MTDSEPSYTESELTLDETFDALSHPVRRRILTRLRADSPRPTDELLACTPDRLDDERARITLRHRHLPQLEDPDLVADPADRDVVARGERFDALEPVIDLLATHDERLPGEWP